MKRPMLTLWMLSFLLFSSCLDAGAETKKMGFAIPFPNLTFTHPLTEKDRSYLEIAQKTTFTFREIKGALILVEVISTYCINCEKQAPILTQLYWTIEKDPQLRKKVKILGIAAGNTSKEVEAFKKEYQIPFPIFSDPKFDAHVALGEPRTPFTLWVRKDAAGNGVVVSTHLGVSESVEKTLAETRVVLQYDLALLKPRKGLIYQEDALIPPLSEEELLERIKKGMEVSGGKVLRVEKLTLKDGEAVYMGRVLLEGREETFFSKLASRRAVCDVCHDTFFIYIFNSTGKVMEILPVQLTKIDNLQWTEEEVQKLKSRIVGKSILRPFSFDPKVDSVSGATITAALVFDSLDKAKEVFKKLRREGYVK